MLRDLKALDAFLEEIFAATPLPISVKTRLGMEDPEEFPAVLEVFNRYPIKELTIHPRVRKQFYDGQVHAEMFQYALENSRNPLCFNGDIRSKAEADAVAGVEAVMIGRALVGDPGMLLAGGTDVKTLETFHNELLDTYTEAFGGGRNAMFRLKENWHMLIGHFEGSEKLWKRLRKTTDLAEFKAITAEIFHTLQFR
jgi:tRNA-dihydrouridine synthase